MHSAHSPLEWHLSKLDTQDPWVVPSPTSNEPTVLVHPHTPFKHNGNSELSSHRKFNTFPHWQLPLTQVSVLFAQIKFSHGAAIGKIHFNGLNIPITQHMFYSSIHGHISFCNLNSPNTEFRRCTISSPYAPYIPMAAAPTAGKEAAKKGTPSIGNTIPCLSSTTDTLLVIVGSGFLLITIWKRLYLRK